MKEPSQFLPFLLNFSRFPPPFSRFFAIFCCRGGGGTLPSSTRAGYATGVTSILAGKNDQFGPVYTILAHFGPL